MSNGSDARDTERRRLSYRAYREVFPAEVVKERGAEQVKDKGFRDGHRT